jgi:uncharacterized lipoprotein
MRTNYSLLVSALLAACAADNSRYQDTGNLERPPEMPIDKQAAEQIAANEIEPTIRRRGKGLKSDVYRVDGSSTAFQIKRGFDESWSLLHQAILQNELKVADEDRSKGFYFIAYGDSGLFGKAVSVLDIESDKATYLLKLEPQGEESKVTVGLANKDEQSASKNSPDDADSNTHDQSQDLSELLFDTLHDKVKDD